MESNFDGKVLIIRNFISQEDCEILNDWTAQAIKEDQFTELVRKSDIGKWPTKQDTKKIRGAAGRSEGKDGVMVTITYDQGEVNTHKDFMENHSDETHEGLRCNILTSKSASGGLIISDGLSYDLNIGDMMCFLATKYEHSVEKCIGDIPRILFIYGFILSSGEWEKQQAGEI